MLNIWKEDQKRKRTLRIIIPIILYHGKKKWRKRRVSDYFSANDPILQKYLPKFEYLLSDLSLYKDEMIMTKMFTRVDVRIALVLMKNIFHQEQIRKHLKDYLELGTLYTEGKEETDFLEAVIRYILSGTDIEAKEVVKTAGNVNKALKEVTMSTAQRLIEQGAILDKQEVLIKQLSKKFGTTSMDEKMIKSIKDKAKLDAALDEILFAGSKEVVLRTLGDQGSNS